MLRPALVALCAATIATGAMGQSTGIAVCDELFGKWEACLTKMPDFDRKIQKSILDELRRSVGEQLTKDLREPAAFACKTSAHSLVGTNVLVVEDTLPAFSRHRLTLLSEQRKWHRPLALTSALSFQWSAFSAKQM
jgi:hypothetical protein